MQFYDRYWLNSVGRILCMDDFVQASLGTSDVANSLPLGGHKIEATASEMGMVALLIKCSNGHQHVIHGWHVQGPMEGEISLCALVWHLDYKRPMSNGWEVLLVGSVQEDWWGEG